MSHFVHNSHQLFYREQGNGPLLLILPGNTASSACYEDEIGYFARHYRVVSLDFWGTGQSERLEIWPDEWWELGAYDAAALVKHLGEERAMVMGSSGGGVVALLMAMLAPERVKAVIADSCLEKYPGEVLHKVVQERIQKTPKQVEFWEFAHGEDWQQVIHADSARLIRLAQKELADWSHGQLKNIHCPVLLTGSLQDKVLPGIGLQLCNMASQIPDSRVLLVNQGDHPLMWSRRDDFCHASDYFLKYAVK
jgi:pimeloyl-ACP methyl ester carboxylesterase